MYPSRLQTGSRTKSAAFTLIEVLVVVAIIALLIAILMPSLAKARRQAKMTTCNANLHDFGTTHLMYANSNDPYFVPPLYIGSSGTANPVGLASDDNLFALWLFKYAKNINSWSCPATTYRVRTPEVTRQATLKSRGPVNGLPVRNFQDYDYKTDGVAGQLDFADIAQIPTRPAPSTHVYGFGSSYEYHGWSLCAKAQGIQTVVNWWWPNYGIIADGALITTRINKPSGQYSVLMHDADEDGAAGSVPGVGGNNNPDPWDNHGTDGLNILFADGHCVTARPYNVRTNVTQIDQIWNVSDCGQKP